MLTPFRRRFQNKYISIFSVRTANGPRTDPERSPNGPRKDPEQTPNGSRTDPERTPNDQKIEMYLNRNVLDITINLTNETHHQIKRLSKNRLKELWQNSFNLLTMQEFV